MKLEKSKKSDAKNDYRKSIKNIRKNPNYKLQCGQQNECHGELKVGDN